MNRGPTARDPTAGARNSKNGGVVDFSEQNGPLHKKFIPDLSDPSRTSDVTVYNSDDVRLHEVSSGPGETGWHGDSNR